MDEKERLMFAARTAGIGEEEARQRIEKLLLEQRDRFELAWATEAGEPVEVQLPAPLKQIGWRWKYADHVPEVHRYSDIFTDDKPGPPAHTIAAANNSCFGPVTVQPVYVLELPTNGSSVRK